jgi:PAS domain S-box-containing protein/putative nucleotidyltransferase with HDIG domain
MPCPGGSLTMDGGNRMNDRRKTKQQLMEELAELRWRVADLEESGEEERRVSAEWQRSAEKYRSIFDNAVQGIFQSTPEGRFLLVNPTIAEILGFSSPAATVSGVSDIQQLYVDPAARTEFKRQLELRGVVRGFETQVCRKDRRAIWVSLSAQAVRGEDGSADYYEGTIEDISRRKQRERELEAIAALGAAIRSIAGRDRMLAVILRHVADLLNLEEVAFAMRDPLSSETVIELAVGKWRGWSGCRLRPGEGVIGPTITKNSCSFSDSQIAERGGAAGPACDLAVDTSVPLLVRGEAIGAFWLGGGREIDADGVRLLAAISELAANAIQRATLHEQLTFAYDATIEGWSRALDLRDKETEGHSRRVTEMAVSLARAIGLGEAELAHVRRGALLHDIGKMGIPDHILHKPGGLTHREWEIMRRHPRYAHEMLWPVRFVRPALAIPHCHHEKWDGSGYPRGLKGEQIPLMARVFTVVDVWDALRSDRPYRAGWPADKARGYIARQAGRQFDPEVVRLFLRMAMT